MTTTKTTLSFVAMLFLFLPGACADSDDEADNGAAGTHADAGSMAGNGGRGGSAGSAGSAGSGGTTAGSGGSSEDASVENDGGMLVDLGAANDFVILAKTGISTVPGSSITGDIGVSPAAATYITGFSLNADATNVFATSTQVEGQVFASDYEPPTPSNMTAAISDMETAFSDAASRAPSVTELGAGDIGGMSLMPGTYKWSTGLLIPADVTLVGDDDDVWIFQIAQDLTVSSGVEIVLEGGAQPSHIFWQVSGEVTLNTTTHLEGTVLSQTAITLRTGASVNGRLLAQTSVDLDNSTVVEP
jgi:hypothetical protein